MNRLTHSLILLTCLVASTGYGAWFQDRDNTMVDVHDDVAESMVLISTKSGTSMGTKIYCPKKPGTILAAGHSIANKKTKAVFGHIWSINAFPLTNKEYSKVSSETQIVSPWRDSLLNWDDPTKDYAFITPDQELKPNAGGVKIVNTTAQSLTQASQNNFDVHLYRGKSKFNKEGPNTLSFKYKKKTSLKNIYDIPQKVKQKCKLIPVKPNYSATDCPLERGVSGSPFIITSDGQGYITGIVEGGVDYNSPSFNNDKRGSTLNNSNSFCKDYQKVCGVACTPLSELE